MRRLDGESRIYAMNVPIAATVVAPRLRPGARVPEPITLALAGGALAALVMLLGPPGTDYAAHSYQSMVFGRHGFDLWDNHWYAGRYAFVTYSVLFYPLAALLGMAVVAIVSVALSVGVLAGVFEHEWGSQARWAARTFAVVWPAFLLTATFPFTLGALFALLTFRALQRSRVVVGCGLCVLTLASSPLAFALLALVLAAVAVGVRRRRRAMLLPALTLLGLGGLELLIWRMFPSASRNPFPLTDMLAAVAFCLVVVRLTLGIERARVLRWVFAVYGLATLGAYVIPSAVGAGISRFQFFALPIAVLAVSLGGGGAHRRRLVVLVGALAVWLNVPALASSLVSGERTSASNLAYWQPAIAFLNAHDAPSYRVEAVDTVGHWPAVYLPQAGIPLARGWFRQEDFPQNAVFYRPLDAGSYATWLQLMGVRYVVLSDTTPDYSARQEALLLRSGRSGLELARRTAHLSIYEVRSPSPLIVGPRRARVVSLAQDGVTVALAGPGTYRLAIRYTPYWRPTTGCVSRAADGMTFLDVRRSGRVRLDFAWSAERAFDAVVGAGGDGCRVHRGPARGHANRAEIWRPISVGARGSAPPRRRPAERA